MEIISDCAIGNKFVDQKEFTAAARGAAVKGDKIRVAKSSEHFNFIQELCNPLVIAPE